MREISRPASRIAQTNAADGVARQAEDVCSFFRHAKHERLTWFDPQLGHFQRHAQFDERSWDVVVFAHAHSTGDEQHFVAKAVL